MDVETSFDLEKDKCLKILLMFFQPQELRKKNERSEKLNRLPELYTYEHF